MQRIEKAAGTSPVQTNIEDIITNVNSRPDRALNNEYLKLTIIGLLRYPSVGHFVFFAIR